MPILHEPTAVLTPAEAEALSRTTKLLVANGLAIIFISHKLNAVMAVRVRVPALRGKMGGREKFSDRRDVGTGGAQHP